MERPGMKIQINPEWIKKLSSGKGELWSAAHDDGSNNRINGDTVLEAAGYGTGFGLLAAGAQWVRKLFRNRGKTTEDLEAEKEAAIINRTSGALEVMLLEYFRAVQDGVIHEEALDELIDTLEEMHEYHLAGKLIIPGEKDLADMRKGITEYTAAVAEKNCGKMPQVLRTQESDEFFLIREQLMIQKELIGEKERK